MQSADNAGHHVVFCADRNYLPYLGVTAYSLLASNPGLRPGIHVVTDEVDDPNRQRLDRLSAEFGVPVKYYAISAEDRNSLAGITTRGHFSIATYFRLLIARALPEAMHKVLYLDADMIVDGDVSALLDSDVTGRVLGACPDPVGRQLTGNPAYFNTGTLLINLQRWRELDIPAQALAYAVRHDPKFCDQDALNAVVPREAVLPLGLEYNCMVYDRLKPEYRQDLDRMNAQAGVPKIFHFTGAIKPWHAWYTAEHQDRFLDYLRRSPWHDMDGLLKMQPATAQQEFWLGERAERDGNLRLATACYKRAAARQFRK